MISIRRSEERGPTKIDWLDSKHTFSFAGYYDPRHIGFGPLRVINEDRVVGGAGFPQHGHDNMEIISYVIDGALAHEDSIGTGSVIRPGDLQRMSAGTGILHSEYNASKEDPVHFLQIWIIPDTTGLQPSYEQKHFPKAEKRGSLRLIGSRNGRQGSITIHQDVDLYSGLLSASEAVTHHLEDGRGGWLQMVRGEITINGNTLRSGDGAKIEGDEAIEIRGMEDSEFLLFDMAI